MNDTALDRGTFPLTVHTSRIVHLPPGDAEIAFGASEATLGQWLPTRKGGFRVDLPGGHAVLRAAVLEGRSKGTRRRLVGSLHSRHRWVTVPIELEISPHSGNRSELGVRPVGSICLRCRSAYRLFTRLAPALLDAVALEVGLRSVVGTASRPTPEQPPERPLRSAVLPSASRHASA